MPKKSSSKTPLQKAERRETKKKEEKGSIKEHKEKASNEIDDIFSGKKRKKPQGMKNTDKAMKSNKDKKNKKMKEDDGEKLNEPSSRPRKTTADGFVIYSEEELGINKSNGGTTPLCPFDCDCCF